MDLLSTPTRESQRPPQLYPLCCAEAVKALRGPMPPAPRLRPSLPPSASLPVAPLPLPAQRPAPPLLGAISPLGEPVECARAPGPLYTCGTAGCGYSTSVRSSFARHSRSHCALLPPAPARPGGAGPASLGCCSKSCECTQHARAEVLDLESALAFKEGILTMREQDRADARAEHLRRAAAAAAGEPEADFEEEESASTIDRYV